MELSLLASAAAILLKEAFPHLKDLAGDAGAAALKKVAGEKGREWAEAVGLLKKKVDEDPVAGALTGVLEQSPDALRLLRDQLLVLLERDESFRSALLGRLEGLDIDVGEHGLAVLGDMHAEQVATGGGAVQIRVTNGNVYLGQRGETAGPGGAESAEPDHQSAYLHWVMEQTRDLALRGVDPSVAARDQGRHLQLAGVYTALHTTTPRHGEALFGRHGLESGVEPAEMLGRHHGPPVPALEQLEKHDRLVLLGQPGGGKSTFVDFVAHCLAGEALGSKDANLEALTSPLPQDDGTDADEGQTWSRGTLLPIKVILRDVAARVAKPAEQIRADDLLSFILETLSEAALEPCCGSVEKALRDGDALILLDGLDEVPEAKARRKAICTLVELFVAAFSKCRFVVTSRTYAYQDQGFRLKNFEVAELAAFGDGQIRRFVRRWYEQVAAQKKLSETDAKGRAVLLEKAIFASRSLRELAERPLLLTLMASLHAWRGGSLPRDRQRLYADTVELLLDVWEGQRREKDEKGNLVLEEPSLTEWLRLERGEVLGILSELAFEAHRAQPETVGTADIPAGQLVGRLMKLKGKDAEDVNPKHLADYLSKRAGILEERGDEVYTFPHRTFQEYLAARHLTEADFDYDKIAELGRNDPNRWREVVLLAGAALGKLGTWELAHSLAFEQKDASATAEAWGLHLAGHVLAESANLKKVSARNRERLDEIRERSVDLLKTRHLPAAERALAGTHLATLGDPRFEAESPHLLVDEMAGFIKVPGGRYVMGSTEEEIKRSIESLPKRLKKLWIHDFRSEGPRHEVELNPFYLARFPVTVTQFRTYVEASSLELSRPEAIRGVANNPIVNVSWHEARGYCRWLGCRLQEIAPLRLEVAATEAVSEFWAGLASGHLCVRLPSESQWEAAARSPEGRTYPWGEQEPNSELVNFGDAIGAASTVGIFDRGCGPYGHAGQAGNVWEWCLDEWIDEDPEVLNGAFSKRRALRGGSWGNPAVFLRAACRSGVMANLGYLAFGFRVAICASQER